MGNLYGSEYWTYLLPRRLGEARAREMMQQRLPLLAEQAVALGLLDGVLPQETEALQAQVHGHARALVAHWSARIEEKRRRRVEDETAKPLAEYRREELERMQLNFYGFDSSYHVARYHFVQKWPKSRTPRYLARHRDIHQD